MFQLLTPTDATLRTLTPRVEVHGDDEVSAISLGLTISGPNTLLDTLAPGLRDMLYKAVEGQDQLPGVEPATPLLRAKGVESVALAACFEGWTLKIARGIDADDPIALGGCKVDAFKVVPREGGTIDLTFRAGSSDIDEGEAGWLFGKLRQLLSITLHAPAPKAAAIDGRSEAFRRDHPGAADDGQADLLGGEDDHAAGDAFSDAHGGPDDDGQGEDGEGDAPDAQAGQQQEAAKPRRRSRKSAAEVE